MAQTCLDLLLWQDDSSSSWGLMGLTTLESAATPVYLQV